MTAQELFDHFRKMGTWVNWNATTDHFQIGDPNTEIKAVAVGWQARLDALKKAHALGCNLFITHEQFEYPEPQVARKGEIQPYEANKRRFCEEKGLVVFRCHDVWDRVPHIGIVDAWAAHLGLTGGSAGNAMEAVHPAPVSTLQELAEYVLEKTKPLGQDSVEMVGDPKAKITRVGIGCGAGTDYHKMVQLGADAIIGTDDGMHYWAEGSWVLDKGLPLVLVNHTVAEEPGLKKLAEYIESTFGIKAHHIPLGSMYRLVGRS
ncbi:MAG: Nif3-like dinuclear metal center hexameric protein [Armatimonadota bacterium]|nr:Nif3-like dinuclear metal center hexameric protein [Armatimonadota bacterium]